MYDAVRHAWEREIDELAEQTGYERADVALVTSVAPGEVIASMARDHPGVLVCMSTQGRSTVDRMLLGSVTSYVLTARGAPVLLVGPAYTQVDVERYEQLIVCLDRSERDGALLEVARHWARELDLAVELVHVADPAGEVTGDELDVYLAGLAGGVIAEGLVATCTVLAAREVAPAIVDLLSSRMATIAVVAPRGRAGLRRLLVGSVTAELLAASPAPVLVAPIE